MRAPRWWRCLRAALTGYFWLPCPICSEPFGGYEKGCGTAMNNRYAHEGRITCPQCARDRGMFIYEEAIL